MLDDARSLARTLVRATLNALAEYLEGGIARNTKARAQLLLHGGVHLGENDGRVVALQLCCCLLILGSQVLAVAAPSQIHQVYELTIKYRER